MTTPDSCKTFFERVVDAWDSQGLPTSQLGIAKALGMSQGSVGRWARGEGLPELEVLRDIAERGKVSIDWLLTGRATRRQVDLDEQTLALLDLWGQLEEAGRQTVHVAAQGALALQKQTAGRRSTRTPAQSK